MYKGGLIIALSIICSRYCFSQVDRTFPIKGAPRNIIIISVNGMGMNQVGAAALKKGTMLSLANFPVTGFTQPWPPHGGQPSDTTTAMAIGTNRFQNPAMGAKPETIFGLAKEKKMKTALIVTGPVTGTAKTFVFGNADKKENEALALDYLNSNIDIIIGGGSKYFDRRYDGRNLFRDFKIKGYNVESRLSGLNRPYPGRTVALLEKDDINLVNSKDFLTKSAFFAIQSMGGESGGYLLVIDDSKIEVADSLNSISLLTDEMLELDKLVAAVDKQTGSETLVVITGNYESGGLEIKNGDIKPKQEPEVSWQGKTATAALAPVFAKGPGAAQFSGFYSQADIYKKLALMITSRQ